jgi:hypothetical protein
VGGSSVLYSPLLGYSGPDAFTYTATAGGAPAAAATAAITVGVAPPTAAFVATPDSGQAPLDVAFADQSTGAITSYAWDFGDGESSAAANPQHTYDDPGIYTVKLTVTGPGGADEATAMVAATAVTPPPPPPGPPAPTPPGPSPAPSVVLVPVPAPGPAPAPAPSPSPSPSPSANATIVGGPVRVRNGRARLVVRCTTVRLPSCRGLVSLTDRRSGRRRGASRRAAIGSATFAIRAGRRATVSVRLTPRTRRLLRRRSWLVVRACARTRQGAGTRRRWTSNVPISLLTGTGRARAGGSQPPRGCGPTR